MIDVGTAGGRCPHATQDLAGQIGIGVFQNFVFVAVTELALHIGVVVGIVLVGLHRALAAILIFGFSRGATICRACLVNGFLRCHQVCRASGLKMA